MSDYKEYIFINTKLYKVIERKFIDVKFRSKDQRSINGTLTVDNIGTYKRKFQFTFDCDNRQLLRLHSIWELNTIVTLIDIDGISYSCACVSTEFSPEHFISNNAMDDYFVITLNFEQI